MRSPEEHFCLFFPHENYNSNCAVLRMLFFLIIIFEKAQIHDVLTVCVCVCVSVPVMLTLSLFFCSVSYRKVNKCYRGRSCPIIVHCRQV